MARYVVPCPACHHVQHFLDKPTFRASCDQCDADLHACLTCRFYAPNAADACREPSAERVEHADRANWCEYWQPGDTAAAQASDADAKAKLAALFGDAPAAPGASALDPVAAAKAKLERAFQGGGPAPGGPSAADAAKAKLDALFKK